VARLDRSTLAGLGAIVLWSLTVALARSLTEQLGSFRAAAAVYVVAGLSSLALLAAARQSARRLLRLPRRYVLSCGPLFVLYMLALYLAIGLARDRWQVLEVALVNYLWCPLTLLLSVPLLGKRAGALIVPGTLLAVGGVFLVLTQGSSFSWRSLVSNVAGNPTAYLLALAAAVTWALYSNLTRRLAGAEETGGVLLFLPVTGAVLLVLGLFDPVEGAWSVRAAAEALVLGLATTGAYLLWDVAMRKGDVVLVAACSYFVPLFSTLLSSAYLAVAPGASLWIGCVLIVAGSLISWISIADRGPAG
jgi:drug/metabolite transporter (DMT)-like permease